MVTKQQLEIIKDLPNKQLLITRDFDAERNEVWRAWTEPELLDQWWAPQPYKAVTRSMDFRVGGYWLYYMQGPEGDRHNCKVDFTRIDPKDRFDTMDYFCDEEGNRNEALPIMNWQVNFIPKGETTEVKVTISFDKEADINTIIEMGFEQGFAAALENLDRYFLERK